MDNAPLPDPGLTPTGYQRTTGGKGFKWQPPTAEHLSKLLPQYEIECILGHGGMGAVYKGKQKSLDRLVAIKILPPEVDDEDASYVERFKNEAKVMAKFMHPAIVGVFDFGETSEGQLYIVMEYVDGTDVQKMIESQGRLPPEHALAITAHVCDALRYAHEHGVIHRDIKPANILINMEGAVKVADFGLAKADEAGSSGLTKTGMAMGTPDYVAPEALIMGVSVDGRADLYAIGVMLYNMLTGNVPRGMFKPASVMLAGTDPRFDAIVAKAMQHDRDDRYQSAAEIRRDLDIILTTPMVKAGGQSSAAIPKAAIAQKPVSKGPQKPLGKSANVPVRSKSTPAGDLRPELAEPASKNLAWVIPTAVSAVVILGGAFYMRGKIAVAPAEEPAPITAKITKVSPPIKVREDPKPAAPAPAPVSNPTPAVGNTPLLADAGKDKFPPGKWVKVFTSVEEMGKAGVTTHHEEIIQKDGWFVPSGNVIDLRFSRPTGPNLGIRGRFKSTRQRVALEMSSDGSSHRFTTFLGSGSAELSIPHVSKVLFTGKANVEAQKDEFTMEYASFEGRYIGRLEGNLMFALHDQKRAYAKLGLYNSDAFRDIEVINLDGLSEAEALKILGVDEKGNDLRQKPAVASSDLKSPVSNPASAPGPSATPSPSLPVAASSDKYPPGKWVKVFTTFEDLPEDLRKPDSGVKFEDGWIDPSSRSGGKGFNFGQLRFLNIGVRAVIDYSNNEEAWLGIRTSDPQAIIEAAYSTKTREFGIRIIDRDKTPGGWHHAVRERIAFTVGRKAMIEIGAVGDRVIAHLDSRLLPIGRLANLGKGGATYNGRCPIRDIEVINLDGLPEAEALRILGVDEKGNDLRATLAKQEQQMAEQAKVVDAMAAIPELKALHEQFTKLTNERISAPFEADLAKLNNGYLGGIDRKIDEERGKGNLDGVLALEEEKKLIQGVTASSRQPDDPRRLEAVAPCPIPADNDQTTATLKGLRQIYRDAFSKLEATSAANLKLLTDPLSIRLKQLESTLTQQNRIEHAKAVRDYREGLGKTEVPEPAVAPPQTALGGPSALPAAALKSNRSKSDLVKSRQAVEYALGRGCEVGIDHDGVILAVKKLEDLPKSRWGLHRVKFSLPVTDEDLHAVTRAVELKEFVCSDRVGAGTFKSLAPLANTPELTILMLSRADREFSAEDAQALLQTAETLRQLMWLNVQRNDALLSVVAACKSLDYLYLNATELTDDDMDRLRSLPLLRSLNFRGSKLTDAGARNLAKLRPLIRLSISDSFESGVTPLTSEGLAAITKAHGDTLTELSIGSYGSPHTEGMLHVIAEDCPRLESLTLRGNASAAAITGLSKVKNLKQLNFGQISGKPIPLTVAQCQATSGIKSLETLSVSDCGLTEEHLQGLAGLKSLKTLHLNRSPGIKDAAVPFLLNFQELENLGLVNAGLTPEGILKLAALKNLRTLTITGIDFTNPHLAQFKAALPGCNIVR